MRVKIKDIAKQIRGVSYKPIDVMNSLTKSSITLLRANNISDGSINFEEVAFINKQRVKGNQLLRKGDILICTSSGSKALVGKAAYVDNDMNMTFGAFCKVVRPIEGNTRYLGYFFDSPYYRYVISNVSAGANINNIKTDDIDNLEVEWPNIERQNEIAEILDKITNVIALRNRQIVELNQLVKSRFLELFGDLKLNNKNWKFFSFPEFALIDTQMIHDFHNYEDYPHIGIDSIEKDTGNILAYRTISEDHVISGKYLFTANHIIYSKIRPNLNKVALPDFDGLCSADAYPILPIEGKSNRYFLAFILRSNLFLSYILAFSNRTNLPKVNKVQIERFRCPLPPIEMQDRFAVFYKQVDKSKMAVQKSLDELETLKKSLMQTYFG